jgi:hypothetical protein
MIGDCNQAAVGGQEEDKQEEEHFGFTSKM